MKKNLYYIFYIGVLMMFLAGCQDEGLFTSSDDELVSVSYRVKVEDDLLGRAIGDASQVNNLTVVVFDKDNKKVLREDNLGWSDVQKDGLSLPLFKGTYKVLFWLQYADDNLKPYTIADDAQVSVSYDGWTGNISDVEKWDAFYWVDDLTISNAVQNKPVTLTRPVGQLNWATQDEFNPEEHQVKVTLSNVATTFQPLTNTASGNVNLSFTFNDFTDETLTTGEEAYTYLTCNYLFPATLTATFDLQKSDGTSVKNTGQLDNIVIAKNMRTNVLGSIVQEPEAPVGWDSVTLTQPKLVEGHYIIDEPSDLAWLTFATNVETLTGNIFEVTKDIDMNCTEETGYTISSLQLKEGSIFIGGGYTIKNFANSFFGNATNLTVQNLVLDNVHADSDGHVGVLVNTLTGSSTFTGVSITNSSATTSNGAAGGMIGYIVRNSVEDRSESLEVKLEECSISQTTLEATHDKGQFVGLLSGYDNGEKLTFSNCTADVKVPGTYSDFLGDETYCRGLVTMDGNRFMPKWDGKRTIEPLLANPTYDGENVIAGTNKFVVYSPFDLAGVRKKTASPAAIYLRADIDMNGQGVDGKFNVPSNFTQSAHSSTDDNVFDPFSYVTTLDGKKSETENYSIYNLSIAQIEQERAAFILYASGTTSHKNINFRNCQTVAVHKPVSTDAKAYGAILVSNVDATYTMENVHAYDCKVFALQKVGTLGARISGTSTLKNNSVNNCYVENYECKISERFSSGEKTIGSWTVTVYADFYPYGEVGGMYGFIQGNSTLTGCKVNGTTIYALGQDDKMATTTGSLLARLGIAALGYYKVPGRHVSTLIGNIRATGTVTLTDCSVDTNTKCTKRHDKHNSTYNYIGQAYIVKFVDSEGSVTVDGNKLTLADCNKNTKL